MRACLQRPASAEFQYIEIYNVYNVARFSTYVIAAADGSRQISLNEAAARKAVVGDILIITADVSIGAEEVEGWRSRIVFADERNRVVGAPGK